MPGEPAWRRPPQSRSPPWRSRPPGGSLQPQRPPRRLPPPELRSFAARRGSGWGGRDPMSVIRRTCSHSELSVASFVHDDAGYRLTSDPALPAGAGGRQGHGPGARAGGPLPRGLCAGPKQGPGCWARPLPGSCSSLLPGSSFHMSPPSRSSVARPNPPPRVWGRRGRPQAPATTRRRLPPGHPLRGIDMVAKFAAGELRWRIPFPVYFDRKSERVFDQRKGDVIKGNRRMHNFLNHTKKYLFHYSKTSLTIQITC